ncbi:MAG: tRNA (adenosine(37)-N6)-threonylcarbamoyltransferase complex ATPase subunit type 1 TsaE [Gammaproteobacteria bacterium]
MISTVILPDEAATLAFGRALAEASGGRGVITLQGDLGSGKTTLSRAVIQALGHKGAVKSPTYTLVEPYELPTGRVLHYDLYRLNDPEELHFLGMRDFLGPESLTLIEWPERGQGWLPEPDLAISIIVVNKGRELSWLAHTDYGRKLSQALTHRYR